MTKANETVWDHEPESKEAQTVARLHSAFFHKTMEILFPTLLLEIAEIRYAFGPGAADREEEVLEAVRSYLGISPDDDMTGMEGG